MGEIISSKVFLDKKIVYKILLDKKENIALKNAIRNITIFSGDLCNDPARIIKRGKNGVTQYFEIPYNMRFRKKRIYKEISYQKIETASKIFYIYVIPKDELVI